MAISTGEANFWEILSKYPENNIHIYYGEGKNISSHSGAFANSNPVSLPLLINASENFTPYLDYNGKHLLIRTARKQYFSKVHKQKRGQPGLLGVRFKISEFKNIPEFNYIKDIYRNEDFCQVGHFISTYYYEMRRKHEVKGTLKIILKEPDVNCNAHEQEKDYEFQKGVEQVQIVAETIIDKPKKIPELKDKAMSEAWARNPIIAWNALNAANYLCEISDSHKTFASNISGKNYVEAHHLIPMSYQSSFDHSLDVECNINSLCPNCHKLIHLAVLAEKKPLIATLYELRKDRLAKVGLQVDLDTLLKMYS